MADSERLNILLKKHLPTKLDGFLGKIRSKKRIRKIKPEPSSDERRLIDLQMPKETLSSDEMPAGQDRSGDLKQSESEVEEKIIRLFDPEYKRQEGDEFKTENKVFSFKKTSRATRSSFLPKKRAASLFNNR